MKTLCILLLLFLVSCGPEGVGAEGFASVENGMSREDVESVLGAPTSKGGKLDAERVNDDIETWVWKDGGKKITVTFNGDEVAGKTKAGF